MSAMPEWWQAAQQETERYEALRVRRWRTLAELAAAISDAAEELFSTRRRTPITADDVLDAHESLRSKNTLAELV